MPRRKTNSSYLQRAETTRRAWLLLLAFTLSIPAVSHAAPHSATLNAFVVVAGATKFFIVGFTFMELSRSHRAWSYPFLAFLAVFHIAVLGLTSG